MPIKRVCDMHLSYGEFATLGKLCTFIAIHNDIGLQPVESHSHGSTVLGCQEPSRWCSYRLRQVVKFQYS